MFTGIVEEAGVVEAVKPTRKSITLTVRARGIARGIKLGASMAVNGCCLTVVKIPRAENSNCYSSMCYRSHGGGRICNSPSPARA